MRAPIAGLIRSGWLVVALAGGLALLGPRGIRAGEWQSLGPDGGNIDALAVDSGDPRILYSATKGGLFRSTNSGRRWQPIGSNLTALPTAVAADPFVAGAVLAATPRGVYRSLDAGTTWVRRSAGLPGEFSVTTLRFSSRQRNLVLALGVTIALHPTNPLCQVVRSLDGGKSWSTVSAGLPADATWFDVAPDAFSSNIWYLASSLGVYRSRDSGRSWRALSLADRVVRRIAPDPWRSGRLWALASAEHGWDPIELSISTDGGLHWQHYELGGTPAAFTRLEVDPARRDHVYLATQAALWLSPDAGRTWRQVLSRPVAALVADRATGAVTAALADADLMRSLDGETWKLLPLHGVRALTIAEVAVGDEGALWGTDQKNGVWVTRNEGGFWARGLPFPRGFLQLSRLLADPDSADVAYVGSTRGLFRTRDGAASWEMAGPPAAVGTDQGIFGFDMDPEESRHLYAQNSAGLSRTTDGGDTWHLVAPTFVFPSGITIGLRTVASGTPPVLFGMTSHFTPHSNGTEVFRSTDEGATWTSLLVTQGAKAIVVDPHDSRRIWVAFSLVEYLHHNDEGGVYRSTDAGATWTRAAFALTDLPLADLVLDSNDPDALYAGGATGVFASHDGGATWSSIALGLRGTNVQRLALRPGSPSTLYAATSGGVFALTLDGAGD